MPDVFVSYSWSDRHIVDGIILPFLTRAGFTYFVDHEEFELEEEGGPDQIAIGKWFTQMRLDQLGKTSPLAPWESRVREGVLVSNLPAELEQAIAGCEIHLVVFTRNAGSSFWVSREIEFSLSLGRKIAVVRVDDAVMPNRLGTLVHAEVVPSVRFTGQELDQGPGSWNEAVRGLASSDPGEQKAAAYYVLSSHRVVARHPTDSDLDRLRGVLEDLLTVHGFDARDVHVTEREFRAGGVRFQFILIRGLPYFRRLCVQKTPISVRQYSLHCRDPAAHTFVDRFSEDAGDPGDWAGTNMTWDDAMSYCRWLSRETDLKIRLPYELEWEAACRAGSTALYCFGDDIGELDEYAYFDTPDVHPVGRKRANAWGFHDMHGNVGEWCHDYHDIGAVNGVQSVRTHGKIRVVRGGAGFLEPATCTSSFRHFTTADSPAIRTGFRLFWELSAQDVR